MFKLDGKTLPVGVPFTHNDIQYPANWLNLSTPEEKAAIGITEVAEQARPDDRYYWVNDNGDGSYSATPKDLVQLKDNQTKHINATAFNILLQTDYMDSRKNNEPEYTPPANWIAWRSAVRITAKVYKEVINECVSVDELASLPAIEWPRSPDQVIVLL